MSAPQSPRNSAAIQLVYDNLHALPGPEGGIINMLPFAQDSEQTRETTRMVATAIVTLLDNSGHIKHDDPKQATGMTQTKAQCMACHTSLVEIPVNPSGVARVDASLFIAGIASLNPDCASKHAPITLEDMRRKMERDLLEAVEEQ